MNYNVLPIYTDLGRQDRFRPQADGASAPLRCGRALLPFQVSLNAPPYTAKLVYEDGTEVTLNNLLTIHFVDNSRYIGSNDAQRIFDIPLGNCYLKIENVSGLVYYSENMTICDDIYDFLKLTWWDRENLNDSDAQVRYDGTYRNFVYIPGVLGKPNYSYEDTVTTRDGISYADKRILKKTYRCQFNATEEVVDAVCLARLADYCVLYDKDRRYSITDITITPQWTSQPNVAQVTIEFVAGDSVTKNIAKSLTAADIADYNTDYNNDYLIP